MTLLTNIVSYRGARFIPRANVFKAKGFRVDHSRALVKKNEVILRKRLKLFFKQQAKALAQHVLHHYGATHKGEAKPPLPVSALDAIMQMIHKGDWDEVPDMAAPSITAVSVSGSKLAGKALKELGATVEEKVAEHNAELWAVNRAAEMVGRKYVAGELVDNPNAKWNILDSTRDIIRTALEGALRDGSTVSELADVIRESTAFSEERAEAIARTEMAYADTHGAIEAFRECPTITGKAWSPDDEACPTCQENADQGGIPIDDDFASGDDAPPAHPNCECAIIPVFADEMDAGSFES